MEATKKPILWDLSRRSRAPTGARIWAGLVKQLGELLLSTSPVG